MKTEGLPTSSKSQSSFPIRASLVTATYFPEESF